MAVSKKCVFLHSKDEAMSGRKKKVNDLFSENNFYFRFSFPISKKLPWWWNGRHGRLKICCSQGREGSSPSRGTEESLLKNKLSFFCPSVSLFLASVFALFVPNGRRASVSVRFAVVFVGIWTGCCPLVVRLMSACCPLLKRTTSGHQADNKRTTTSVGTVKKAGWEGPAPLWAGPASDYQPLPK